MSNLNISRTSQLKIIAFSAFFFIGTAHSINTKNIPDCPGPACPARSPHNNDSQPLQQRETTNTCRYTTGPKAGNTEHLPTNTLAVGDPCTDSTGSFGVAIPDR
jgi:hypothetical protein